MLKVFLPFWITLVLVWVNFIYCKNFIYCRIPIKFKSFSCGYSFLYKRLPNDAAYFHCTSAPSLLSGGNILSWNIWSTFIFHVIEYQHWHHKIAFISVLRIEYGLSSHFHIFKPLRNMISSCLVY